MTAAAAKVMEKRLGSAAEPYKQGTAGTLMRAGKALSAAGALLTGLGRRGRTAALGGAALVLAGEVCLRWSVFRAGFQSARDPKYTVEPQRRRLEARESASEEPEAGLQPSSSFRSSRTAWTTS